MNFFVRVSNLTKRYNGVTVVDDMSFNIPAGAVFGLLGPNGAGKTTAVSMISGLLQPDGGNIVIKGYSMVSDSLKAKRLMGIVPQEIALYPTLTARENLKFWGRLYGLKGKSLNEKVDQLLSLVGLSERADEAVEKYSGGMKRRVNIAAGLLHEPLLLLLDEPTVGVDPQSRRNILDMIKELNEKGLTVIYTSHYMEEVEELCTLITIMDRGRILASGTREDLMGMVEDTDVIRLDTQQPLADYAFLKQMPQVKGVTPGENSLRVSVTDSHTSLAPVIAAVTGSGIQVSSVTVEQPNLETVFLHLTGRGLRD